MQDYLFARDNAKGLPLRNLKETGAGLQNPPLSVNPILFILSIHV